ncbi:MAG: inositol monophosphatase [Gammaproteobacteria bacterium]|nr:inositol monophosphatase [Gammaproteobacteria bacterium]
MEDLNNLLDTAKEAALLAGDFLRQSSTKNLDVLHEKGRDIKLQIDKDAEDIIKKFLESKSNLPILAEESGFSKDLGETFWVVDPLDGTSNFLREIPIFCVAIAVIHKSIPVVGVINDFHNNDLYFAHKDSKAYKNSDQIYVSDIDQKSKGTLVTGIPAKEIYSDEEFHEMIKEFQDWKKVRMIGSAAMASVYVASGKADTYKENDIFLWDIAAGAALVKASGGNVQISDIKKDFRVNAKFSNSKI